MASGTRKTGRKQVWFRVFLAGGLTLALILLAHTVSTYVYVSGNMVTQAALRDAASRLRSVERHIRGAGVSDPAALSEVLEEVRTESDPPIAWLRLIRPDGSVLASTAAALDPPVSFSNLRGSAADAGTFHETRETAEGTVLVTAFPVRLNPGGRAGALLEMAVDPDAAAASFAYLRVNLVIGVSAALALLGTLVLVRLRFPHYLRGKQLENQVATARSVQNRLLPNSTPASAAAEIAADCQPAGHVGGDFYDVFETDRSRLALILGDVSGKGIAAAPLMGFIHGAAHASEWTESTYDHERASRRLNDLVCRKTDPERFVSMFWAYFDADDHRLRYVNAGHLPALIVRNPRTGAGTRRLEEGGPVLGVVPGAAYTQGAVEIEPDDVLVVYSDGIVEASNARDEEFGEAGIARAVAESWREPAEDIRARILAALDGFTGGRAPEDDRTLIVIRFGQAAIEARAEEAAAEEAAAGEAVAEVAMCA